MRYRLRYQQHDYELAEGEFVIGRGADCQLALDDALVSRRHARLVVKDGQLFVEDLESRNGVRVNGERISERTELANGDKIRIGNQDMSVTRVYNQTPSATLVQPPPTLRADTFDLLGGLADKALAMGRGEEAERILNVQLSTVLEEAKAGRVVPPESAKSAALYAVKVGAGTGKARWIDYVFELYAIFDQPCPAEVVDELYVGVRKVKGIDIGRLRAYAEQMRVTARGPAERFLLSRIEGLEQLVALK